jgi:hypothetical protein
VFLGAPGRKDNMKNSGGKYPPDFWKRLGKRWIRKSILLIKNIDNQHDTIQYYS